MESMAPPSHFTPTQAQLLWLTVRRAEALGQDLVAYVRELTHIGTPEDREAVAVFMAAQNQSRRDEVLGAYIQEFARQLRARLPIESPYPVAVGLIQVIWTSASSPAQKLAEIGGVLGALRLINAEDLGGSHREDPEAGGPIHPPGVEVIPLGRAAGMTATSLEDGAR